MMAQQAAALTQQFTQEMQRQIATLKSSQSVQRSSSQSVHSPNDNDNGPDDDGDNDNDTFDVSTLDCL